MLFLCVCLFVWVADVFKFSVGGDFPTRLDEVSEHYLTKSICEGEECNHLKVQVGHQVDQVILRNEGVWDCFGISPSTDFYNCV